MNDQPVLAALDLGTNNCRLLIARRDTDKHFHVIDAFSRIVRLGEGLESSGALSEHAMARTIEALKICSEKIIQRRVQRVRAVATEACRRACNSKSFLERVAAETGLALEVISATEEASLAFRGTTPLLRANFPYALVFDIGGGSTELGWLRLDRHGRAHILASHSMPLGVVTLTERFGVEPPPGTDPARFYAAMVDAVRSAMWPFAQAIGAGGPISAGQVQMIGTSGTVTTIMGVFLDLPRYDRARVDGGFLQIADFERIAAHLSRQSCGERAAHPCIGRERADLVVAGCAILSAICRQWPVDELRVADRGVREGILMGL